MNADLYLILYRQRERELEAAAQHRLAAAERATKAGQTTRPHASGRRHLHLHLRPSTHH